MHEGFTLVVERRNCGYSTGLEGDWWSEQTVNTAANTTDFERFPSHDLPRASLIIDRLKCYNLALERLLSGLDGDSRAPEGSVNRVRRC